MFPSLFLFIFGLVWFVLPDPTHARTDALTMDLSIQHYKEHNGTLEDLQQQQQQQHPSLAMRTEWEPCLAHHPPLQSFSCDADLAERGPPPPPPPSKRRFRSPTSSRGGKSGSSDAAMMGGSGIPIDERHGSKGMRDTLMGRQVQF